MRSFAELVELLKANIGVGDLNLDVSKQTSTGHALMSEISIKRGMRFLPALAYDGAKLRGDCVSNVHSRGAGQCYDMCLVPCTIDAVSVEFVAIPGDVAYLHALQAFVKEDSILLARHVVAYYNRLRSDHLMTLIKSW